MSIGWKDTPECQIFKSRLMPLMFEFFIRYPMNPLNDVWYFGVDPKSGGRLFLTHFQSEQFLLKVRTSDAAAEVLVGLPGASLRWAAEGWLLPSQVARVSPPWAPRAAELTTLSERLKDVAWF